MRWKGHPGVSVGTDLIIHMKFTPIANHINLSKKTEIKMQLSY